MRGSKRRLSLRNGRLGRAVRRFSQRHLATARQRVTAVVVLVVFLAGLIVPIIATQRKVEAWWNASWSYRRAITINNTASTSTLTNFPVLVKLTTSNFSYANAKSDGSDVRFVDSDDSTGLSYQFDTWSSGGTSYIWVKIPNLTATNYTIYLYYGNTAASDAQAATSVWDTGFKGVWHLGEGHASTYADSTSNANNGNGGGGTLANAPASTTGQFGVAGSFNDTSSVITIANSTSTDITGDITTSAWVKRGTSASNMGAILAKATSSTTQYELYQCHQSGECAAPNTNSFAFYADGPAIGIASNTQLTDTSGWHYLTATRSGSTLCLYLDGVLDKTATMSGAFSSITQGLDIGWDNSSGTTGYYNGSLDELRLSNVARSASWVKAEYLSGTDQMNTISAQQTQYDLGTWWNNSWSYRRGIQIDNSASSTTLTNFPVRVSLTSANINYAYTKSGGADIRFIDSTGGTQLSYEIEKWDPNGTSEIWVKIPSLPASSYTISMYYGNPSATDAQSPNDVWDANYTMVQHLREPPGGVTYDSTSNDNDGTKYDAADPLFDTNGMVGSGQTFNGSPSVITVGDKDTFSPTTNAMSVAAFVKVPTTATASGNGSCGSTGAYFMGKGTASNFEWQMENDNNSLLCFSMLQPGGSTYNSVSYATTVNDGNFHYYEATMTYGGALTLYRDGVQVATSSTTTGSMSNGTAPVTIGAVNGAYSYGTIDEVRISKTARSADWIRAEYYVNSKSYVSYTTEETYSGVGGGGPNAPTLTTISSPASTTPTFQMVATDPTSPTYLRYKIEICSDKDCKNIVRTVDQTSSQTGWTGQDAQAGTAYNAGSGGPSTISYLQGAWAESSSSTTQGGSISTAANGSLTQPFTSNATPNSLIVAIPEWDASHTLSSCSDSLGNTYTIVQQQSYSGVHSSGLCYAINTGGAGALTVTATFNNSTASNLGMAVGEYSGVKTTSPVDGFNQGQGTASAGVADSVTSGSWTTTQAGDLIIGGFVEKSTLGTNSAGTGFTYRTGAPHAQAYLEDMTQSAAGSIAATYTFGLAHQYTAEGTAFKAAPSLSTTATYTLQAPALNGGQQYWWRAYAIDPGGSNAWSAPSAISSFTTAGAPQAPTLVSPSNGETGVNPLPEFRMYSTDLNGDDLQYKIDLCSSSDCSTILNTFDQTSSQTGWRAQSLGSVTRYPSATQQASYQYSGTKLTLGATYYWRAYAKDPTSSNTWSSASSINGFTVRTTDAGEIIQGGTTITGGTQVGQ